MKYTFNHFKKLFLESLLNEDKSRLIARLVLPDIDNEDEKEKARDEIKSFFKKYSNFENQLDWNKLNSITYKDFKKVKELINQTKGTQKREIKGNIKNIFISIGNKKFEIVGETKDWLFIAPLSYEAAVYCDSSKNQGGSAKWCIGYEKDKNYWDEYIKKGSLFIMAFNKNYKLLSKRELQTNLKYMIERTASGNILVYNQTDNSFDFYTDLFNISLTQLNLMFAKIKEKSSEMKKEIADLAKQSVREKIKNLINIKKIDINYFTNTEKQYITRLDIPDNIIIIGDNAFMNCVNLKSIIIPNSVKSIGEYAFMNCKKLKSITIPDGIKNIEHGTFTQCENLTTVNIPNSVIGIYRYAFNFCKSLTNITLPKNLKFINDGAFKYCNNLKKIIIPSSVIEIGYDTFYDENSSKTIIFKSRSIDEIKAMTNYPWGLSEKRIKSEL